MAETTPGTAAVNDRRVPPRGVLPRHAQTWLLVGVAVGVLAIILLTGNREPAARVATAVPESLSATSTDRLRDYQDRLRVLDERARHQLVVEPSPAPQPLPAAPHSNVTAPPAPDPLLMERERRAYESLFASNVVVSRRPEAQRLMPPDGPPGTRRGSTDGALPAPPTLDEVAEAVLRATATTSQATTSTTAARTQVSQSESEAEPSAITRPAMTRPISSFGTMHPVLEGMVIDTVLTNRLDGSVAAPVNCLVTSPVYSHDGRYVLIPAGARVLGETKPVESLGDTRLAVAFNRLVMPDGRTYGLDQFMGLNDIGEAGLRDQVNHHYRSTFGASAAVGLISGFAQYLGAGGFNRGSGDQTVIISGAGDATAQATAQMMNRYLNRLPRITIREGHRVKVYVTSDFELPAYDVRRRWASRSVLAGR